jgi:hypothetical protein
MTIAFAPFDEIDDTFCQSAVKPYEWVVCLVAQQMETPMRLMTIAALLAAMISGTSAFAQQSVFHPFCMQRGSSTECAYDTMAQCMESKMNPADSCIPNQSNR